MKTFIFLYESACITRMNAIDRFLIPYLVPEISTFKEPKHDTQMAHCKQQQQSKL